MYASSQHLFPVEFLERTVGRTFPYSSRRSQIRRKALDGIIVIALHFRTLAREHGNRQAGIALGIGTEKALAGRQMYGGTAVTRFPAFGIGDALHLQRRRFRLDR